MWTKARLKHLCVDGGQYGLNVSSDSYRDAGRRLIRTSDISQDGALRSDGVYVDSGLEDRYVLRKGDLLLSRSGTLGRAFLVPAAAAGATFAGYLVRFRPRSGVEPRFLNYVANSLTFQQAIQADAVSSTIQNFNAERYANIRVSFPALPEQRRIADFLDAETSRLDALSQGLTRVRSLLIERRHIAVHCLVSGLNQGVEMARSGLPWTPVIPSHWQAVRLNLLAMMGSGHTPSRSHPEWWEKCTIPWITTGEVSQVRDDRREVITETREKISTIGMANSAAELHPAGTVVLCRTASAGYSAVMGEDMATSQDFVAWTCGPKLDPYYLLWCLRAMRADLLGRLAMGSTHKTIYVPDLQRLRVPVPPLSEQQQIVQKIRESNARVDAAVDAIDHQLALLAERRETLVTEAVTGQIDVTTTGGAGI